MEFIKITLAVLLAAICYGIAQDQVTARVCVEYFTIGHPDPFNTDDPTLLAFGWGIVATWWLGLPVGLLLAAAGRWGRAPKLSVADLRVPMLRVLAGMALVTLLGGIAGYVAARVGWVALVSPYAEEVPSSRHVLFLADGGAHLAAYAGGLGGSLGLCVWTARRRRMLRAVINRTKEGKSIPLE